MKIKLIILAIIAILFQAFPGFSGDYYVSDLGNNATGNGSISKPWKTISFAVTNSTASEIDPAVIKIAEGICTETVTMKNFVSLIGGYNKSFSQYNPAIYTTIVRPAQTTKNTIVCSGKNSLTGLTIKNANYGILLSSGELIVDSCKIIKNVSRGISIEGNLKAEIKNSHFESNPIGIYCFTSTNVTITGNTFTKHTDKAIYSYFYAAPQIIGNTFESNTNCVFINRDYNGNCKILKNKFIGNSLNAVYLDKSSSSIGNNAFVLNYSGVYGSGVSSSSINNNTFLKNRFNGITLSATGSSMKIANNIFSGNQNYGVAEYDSASNPSLLSNCFNNNTKAHYYDNSTTAVLTMNDFSLINNGTSAVKDNFIADPNFKTDIPDDYHLEYGSPCIDIADSSQSPSTDIDGDARPNDIFSAGGGPGADYDLGCDEYYWSLTKDLIVKHVLKKQIISADYLSDADLDSTGDISINDIVIFINTY